LLDAKTGAQLDSVEWKSPFRTNSTTPIVFQDSLFVSTGYQVGCGLFRVVDGKLSPVYTNREMRNHFNNSVLFQGFVYGFDGNSNHGRVVQLKCMNHATGEVVWEHSGLGCGSLMIADGKLLLLSDDGRIVVAEATPKGFRELATAKILSGRCWTVPVLLNGKIYARNAKGDLVCVNLPTVN
jgi:outer membrane protein assembly factor BamB